MSSYTKHETAIQLFNAALSYEHADKIILADVSGSMDEIIPTLGKTKLEVLKETLLRVVSNMNEPAAVLLFANHVQKLTSWEQLDAQRRVLGGSTHFGVALNTAKRMNPSQIVLITDGQPHDRDRALAIARSMLVRLDVFYCGHGDADAVSVCRDLAQYGGQAVIDPSCVTMLQTVTLMLTDAPISA